MKFLRALGIAIPFLAPLLLLVMIARDGVNVPFWDEWGIQSQFLTMENRSAADYFAQSNESRLVVPKLIFVGVSKVLGWQPKHYMFLGWALVCGILLLLWRQSYRLPAPAQRQDGVSLAAFAVSAALLFTPAAYENWLWGIQWVIFVPLLCALGSLSVQIRTRSFAVRYAATTAFNLVAMFSFSNGLIMWAVSFPFWHEAILILTRHGRRRMRMTRLFGWSAAYVLTGFLAVWIYFKGIGSLPAFESVALHSPLSSAIEQPWNVLKYFLEWCGRPFGYSRTFSVVSGAALLLAVFALHISLVLTLRAQRGWRAAHCLRKLYPALVVIAYALASGAMTALGRFSTNPAQDAGSRYLFHSGMLVIGLLAAVNIRRQASGFATRRPNVNRTVFIWAIALAAFFTMRSWRQGRKSFEALRLIRTQMLLNVRMLDIVPDSPLVRKMCPWADLPKIVSALRAHGIYSPPPLGIWLRNEPNQPLRENAGSAKIAAGDGSQFSITGWAFIPGSNSPADSVLVCRRTPDGRREPWLLLAVGHKSKEAVSITGRNALSHSGFNEIIPWSGTELPAVDLFAVDEERTRLFPISLQM